MLTSMPSSCGSSWRGFVRARAMALATESHETTNKHIWATSATARQQQRAPKQRNSTKKVTKQANLLTGPTVPSVSIATSSDSCTQHGHATESGGVITVWLAAAHLRSKRHRSRRKKRQFPCRFSVAESARAVIQAVLTAQVFNVAVSVHHGGLRAVMRAKWNHFSDVN